MRYRFLLAAILTINLPGLQAQGRGLTTTQGPRDSDRRTALVIGNSAYTESPLKNPVNDAQAVARALRDVGFEVTLLTDLRQNDMKRAIRDFGVKLQQGGVGVFYYAGHGVQAQGRNYLIPVGAVINSEAEVEYESVDLGLVLAQMEEARNPLNVVILDACRNNPFARTFRSETRGLAQVLAPSGTLIAYATAPGSVANDGTGQNGLYTQELLKNLRTPDLPIEEVFKRTRIAVRQATQDAQVPWESSSLTGDFSFAKGNDATVSQAPGPVAAGAPAKLAVVEADLRRLAVHMDRYFADHASYPTTIEEAGFLTSEGVTLVLTQTTRSGWAGAGAHADLPNLRCGISVGGVSAAFPGYVADGAVFCGPGTLPLAVSRPAGVDSSVVADGVRLLNDGRPEEAEQRFRDGLREHPTDAELHNYLSVSLYRQGRYRDGEAASRQATRFDPNKAVYWANLADNVDRQGRHDEAERYYREALRLDPNDPSTHNLLGNMLYAQAKYAEAEEEYRQAVLNDPTSAVYNANYGLALKDQQRYSEAENALRVAIDLDSTYAWAYSELGHTLYLQKRYTEAEPYARRAVRLSPDDDANHNRLANTLYSMGRYADAEAEYRRALALDQGNVVYAGNVGGALRQQKRYRDAETALRSALALDSTYAWAHNELGALFYDQGRFQDAEANYVVAVRLDPTVALYQGNLGDAIRSQGRYAMAESPLREAARLDPNNWWWRNSLGVTLFGLARYEEAAAEFREASGLNPTDAVLHNNYGNALNQLRRWPEAAAQYQEAVRLEPNNEEYKKNLQAARGPH